MKSMMGEQLEEVELTHRGFVGDRTYALVATDTDRVMSAKQVPDLFGCRAAFVESPRNSSDIPPVRIQLPEGVSVASDSPEVHRVLSSHFKRDVRLAKSAYDPYFDAFPVSVLTTSTLTRLNELRPESRFDARRFRMNIILNSESPGFVENDWVGREVHIGSDLQLKITKRDSRCVMTTLAQDDLPHDFEILRTLVKHNRIQVGELAYPCAGVYASVVAPGTIRSGDHVTVL